MQGASNVQTDRSGQPLGLELGHLFVQVVALFLEYHLIGSAVQLFEGKGGGILCVNFAKGMRKGCPGVVKVDIVGTSDALDAIHVRNDCIATTGQELEVKVVGD